MTDQYFDFLNPENNSSGDASDSRYVENRVVNNDRYESTGYRHADNGAIPPEPVPGKKKKGGFFKALKAEFKRVIWPDKDTIIKETTAVVVVTVVLGVIIALLDFVIKTGLDKIIQIG